MIRKTFKRNIVLSITNAEIRDSIRVVETVWTVDLQGDKVIDLEIVSCDADLDERQYDRLKEICLAMRHIGAFDMAVIDESVIDVSPKDWNEYLASSK